MLEAGEAGVEQIDRAIVGAGYPMGPFTLMDLVGIDVNYAVAMALFDGFDGAIRFSPSAIQRAAGRGGPAGPQDRRGVLRLRRRRSTDRVGPTAGSGVAEARDGGLPEDEIVQRIELAIINEAYHAAGDGVSMPPTSIAP